MGTAKTEVVSMRSRPFQITHFVASTHDGILGALNTQLPGHSPPLSTSRRLIFHACRRPHESQATRRACCTRFSSDPDRTWRQPLSPR